MGRILKVDHAYYKRKEGEDEEEEKRRQLRGDVDGVDQDEEESVAEGRPIVKEELELAKLMREHDDDDPMKEYLVREKREEVAKALRRLEKEEKRERRQKHRHHHHHRHRERRGSGDGDSDRDLKRGRRHHHPRRLRSP